MSILNAIILDVTAADIHASSRYTNNFPAGSNATGAFIAIFLTAVVIILFLNFRVRFKMSLSKYTNKAGQIIFDAHKVDKFWSESTMLRHSNFILHEYFRGFLKGDWGKIEMYTDKIILEKLKDKFNSLSSKSELFECEHIRIRASKIIHASDHENDNQDEFSIYFEGEIVMIKHNKENKKFRETKDFKHIYTFRRKNNDWMLKEVIDDVVESDLYKVV